MLRGPVDVRGTDPRDWVPVRGHRGARVAVAVEADVLEAMPQEAQTRPRRAEPHVGETGGHGSQLGHKTAEGVSR